MTSYQYKSEQRILKEQAEFIFKEMSSGVYQCVRSLWKVPEFVGAEIVVDLLQQNRKVYVIKEGSSYCNFEADSSSFMCVNVAVKTEKEV